MELILDEESFQPKIKERSPGLFEPKAGKPELEVCRVFLAGDEIKAAKKRDVKGVLDVTNLRQNGDLSQIFLIRQHRSWTTLNLSLELFTSFMSIFRVHTQFWKYAFTFGQKFSENEYEFPELTACQSTISDGRTEHKVTTIDLAYILRRVEIHGRSGSEGLSPWSIRQTAVYHQVQAPVVSHDGTQTKSTSVLLLIAPSVYSENQLSRYHDLIVFEKGHVLPAVLHALLVKESLKGWMDYMAWLEKQLQEQSDRIVFTTVGVKDENQTATSDLSITVADRQALKLLEDSITQLQIILPSLLRTVVRLKSECDECCKITCSSQPHTCTCAQVLQRFDRYISELQMHVHRANVLKQEAKCVSQLLSDLLNHDNAVALREIARESRQENKLLIHLAERSTKDAASVRVLTIIGLIYLPTTIVANFFSTQFVQANAANGEMQVSRHAWLLAAIAIPLTFITFVVWGLWIYSKPSHFLAIFRCFPKLHRTDFPPVRSPWRKNRPTDLESASRPGVQTSFRCQTSPRTLCESSAPTWSTTASTATKGKTWN